MRILVLLTLCLSVFWGCASLPAKAAETDCLVLIPASYDTDNSLPAPREYYLVADQGAGRVLVPQVSQGYMLLLVHGPGVKITQIVTSLAAQSRASGTTNTYPVEWPLPYEPGKLVVADFGVVHIFKRVGDSRNYNSNLQVFEVKPEEKGRWASLVGRHKNAADWLPSP